MSKFGITRFEGYDRAPLGWEVRLFWYNKQTHFRKFFPDTEYGGKESALKAAKEYKEKTLKLVESFKRLPIMKKDLLPGVYLNKIKSYYTFRIYLGGKNDRLVMSKGITEKGMYETFRECYHIRRNWEIERYGGTVLPNQEEKIEEVFNAYLKYGRDKYGDDFDAYYRKYP